MRYINLRFTFILTVYLLFFVHIIQETDVFVIQMLNTYPDQMDLKYAMNPRIRFMQNRMSTQQIKQYIILNGHCSALVKVCCFDFLHGN